MTTQEQVRVRRGDAHEATGVPWVTLLGRSVVFSPSWTALKRVPRIGFLGLGSPAAHAPFLEAFRRGLRDYGYTERETILVEYRWADSQYDRLPQLAMELTRENVDLIVTYGSEGALAAKRTITTLPIVAVAVGDMVGAGVVANLARPEANVTGLSLLGTEVSEKRLSLLRDTIPDLGKVAIV